MSVNRKLISKRFRFSIGMVIFCIVFQAVGASAQGEKPENMTLVVPETGIANLLKGLFPYAIDFGKGFSGAFWIKSIDNIDIKENRVLFSTTIYGEDIKYTAKIADRAVAIEVGKINLHNNWNTALRYDAKEKILYVKPHVEESAKTNGLSHGDMLLNALLMGLSDLEFPIEMKDIQPIATEMNGTNIIINVEILNIYAEGDKLFIEFRPMAQKQK